MTVISGMIFNKTEGALVADEQSSYGIRKSDIATKLTSFATNDGSVTAILGGTGAADILFDAAQKVAQAVKANSEQLKNAADMAAMTAQVMAAVKKQYIDGYLYAKFRLRECDFQAGQQSTPEGVRPIEPSLMQQYQQLISGQGEISQLLNNSFLLMARDSEGIQLYQASMFFANPVPVSRPYETVGSGSDTADSELYAFFERLPRDKRSDITPVEGIAALLSATDRAGVRNQGVGGTPLIAVVKGDKFIMPDETSCKLGVEVVKAAKSGLVPAGFYQEALSALIYGNTPFNEVDAEMWGAAERLGTRKSLELMLRGYKASPQPI